MEAVAIATATNAVKNSTNCSNTNTNSNSSSSSGYGSATTTPLSHYETTTQQQHAATTAAVEAATPPPPQPQQPPAAQTVATVAPYAYSSDSVLAADTQQQQHQQQQRQHYQYTTSPFCYQPTAPAAASLQTLYPQHDPYVGLNYAQHAAAALDYNSSNDLALRERLQNSGNNNNNNNYTNNNAAHSPIEKLAAYANLTASPVQHAAGNMPYKHTTDVAASTNAISEPVTASTPSTKPQATATPFYAAARAPVVSSASSYYEQYKFKMPTTGVATAAADYTNYGCRVPPSTATSYQQQQQQYYAAVKSQLSQSEANYVGATTKSSLSPTSGSVSRQQMNSFYGRANLYYDKYSAAAYPPTPNPATTNLTAPNPITYPTTHPVTHPTPPHYVTDNALSSPESYRKSNVAPPPPASSWHWNMDYSAAATGNYRTLPPPTTAIPTAAIPPTNANSSFLSPGSSALNTTRDAYYNSVGSSGTSSKYDKYNAYAYHQQQQQATALSQRNMWSTATHERLPHVSPHSTHPTHQPLPPPPYPPHPYATQARQNCCSQLPYQHQQQPQQNCYYSRLPPQHAASNVAYPQQHPHYIQQQSAAQHYGSNKYTSNIYADYTQSKLKYPNDLIATSPYDAATYTGYNYAAAAAATTQRYQQATQQHHNITSDAAAAAAYYNDLNLQSTAYESYATTVQQQHQQQQQQQHQQQQSHHLQQPPQQLHAQPRPQQHLSYHQQPSSSSTHLVKNPLLDYRKPNSLSMSLAAPAATPVLPSAADAEFYMHESSNVAATYHNFDSVSNVSLYESGSNVGDSVADKLNAANKNLSLRDFLATWNDDEEDAAAAAAELNFAEPLSATPAKNQVTILQTETLPAKPATDHYLQEAPPASKLDNSQHQFKGAFNARPKIHVGITVDSNMESSQYINLPDIVIDIEKSNNVSNVSNIAAPTHFEDFDVEKELDELQIKRSKLSNEEHVAEQHNATDYSALSVPATEVIKLQEISSYHSLLQDEPQHLAATANTEKVSDHSNEAAQQQEAISMREDAGVSTLTKDLESDNSSLSNESTFEKEYETFINKLGSDVETPSREKFRAASVIMSSASLTAEAEDLSTTQIKIAQPEADTNEESNKQKDSSNTMEQHKYSKFYKRKRKLIDEVASNADDSKQELERNDVPAAVVTAKFPSTEQQNFPLAYTKTCRKRKMLTVTCVRNVNEDNKRPKQEGRCGRPIVAKPKICQTPRRRKPKSLYYKMLHQSSLKKLQARCRLLQHVARLRESHLPLIKRQSIKRYAAAANNHQRASAFNPQTLKCLSVSTLNTEHFRQHFLTMLMANKTQKKRSNNVANQEAADVALNKIVKEDIITDKHVDEDKWSKLKESSENVSVVNEKNVPKIVQANVDDYIPKSKNQKTKLPKTDILENLSIFTDEKSCVQTYSDDIPKNNFEKNITVQNADDNECHSAQNNKTDIFAAAVEEKVCHKLGLEETDIKIKTEDIQNCTKLQSNDFEKSSIELYEVIKAKTEQNYVNESNDDGDDIDDICNTNNKAIIRNEKKEEENSENNNTKTKNEEKLAPCMQNPQYDGKNHDIENKAYNDEKYHVTKADEDRCAAIDDSDEDDDESSNDDSEETSDSDDESSSNDEYKTKETTADHIDKNKQKNAIQTEECRTTDQFYENHVGIEATNATLPNLLNNIIENHMIEKKEVQSCNEKVENSVTSDLLREQESEIVVNHEKHEEKISVNQDYQGAVNLVTQNFSNHTSDNKDLTPTREFDDRNHENDKENINENNANETNDVEEVKLQENFIFKNDEKKSGPNNVETPVSKLEDIADVSCQSQAVNFSETSLTPFETDDTKASSLECKKTSDKIDECLLSDSPRSPENILVEDPTLEGSKGNEQRRSENNYANTDNIQDLYINDIVADDLDSVADPNHDDDSEVAQNKVLLHSSQVNRLVAYEDTTDYITDDLDPEETDNELKQEMLHSNLDWAKAAAVNVNNDFDTEKSTKNREGLRLFTECQNFQSDNLDETSNSSSSSSSPSESNSSSSSDETTTSSSSTSTKTTTTTSEESADGFNEMIALERELSTHYEAVKTCEETSQVTTGVEQKINQDAISYDFAKTTTSTKTNITKNDIASLKKVLEGNEEEDEEEEDKKDVIKATVADFNHKDEVVENCLEKIKMKPFAILKEAVAAEELSHKVRVIETYLEKIENSATVADTAAATDELSHRDREVVQEDCVDKVENYIEKMTEAAAAEEFNHKVAVIENFLEKMENTTTATETAIAEDLNPKITVMDCNYLEQMENSTIKTKLTTTAQEFSQKNAVLENYLDKIENSTVMSEAAVEDLNQKVAVIENYLEKMENCVNLTGETEELSAVVEKPITRNEVEEMLLAAFESAVKEADVLERLEGGVQLMLPYTAMEISHNDTDQFPKNSIIANEDEEMNQVVNFTIPKLSDLCKNALNSSCKQSESMIFSIVDQDQRHHQDNVDHYKDANDSRQQEAKPEQEPDKPHELSVEEALAEMYRQAGVASDPEDFDTDDNDNDKQAQEVLLINLEEILVSDSDNLYVLQCDINENILGVIATQTLARNNNDENDNDNDENDEGADKDDAALSGEVNALELIELFNASDTATPTTNDGGNTNTNTNALINNIENSQELPIKFIHTPTTTLPTLDPRERNTDLVPANISNTTTTTTKILPPASGDDDDDDDDDPAIHHVDVKDFYNDNDFDLPTIHHEEIVPDNYLNYHKEKFLKYLHAKYVQRNISKFYHSNRIIKKYKKRLVQKLLNALAEHKRYGQQADRV